MKDIMQKRKNFSLLAVALVLFAAALLHVVALLAGPGLVAAMGAPENIVQSARQGTMLAPLVILGIGALLTVLGLYALSAAGAFRRLPGVRLVLGAAFCVFLLRALALPAIWFLVPVMRGQITLFEIATALLCFLIGIGFLPGLRKPMPRPSGALR
jgi:hypothetical protein